MLAEKRIHCWRQIGMHVMKDPITQPDDAVVGDTSTSVVSSKPTWHRPTLIEISIADDTMSFIAGPPDTATGVNT